MRMIRQLENEAAKLIQNKYRLRQSKKIRPLVDGKDASIQTDLPLLI